MMVKSCDVLVFYIFVQTEIWVPLKLVIKNQEWNNLIILV